MSDRVNCESMMQQQDSNNHYYNFQEEGASLITSNFSLYGLGHE